MASDLRRFLSPLTFLVMGLGGCEFQRQAVGDAPAEGSEAGELAREVEGMLHASAASWNGGDLDGFLDDYWRSDDLTFSGSGGVTRGWENVRRRYLESYWAPGTVRDSLRFENIEVMPLGRDHALALGRYVLFRPEDGDVEASAGHFSLVLRSMDGGWKIVHDHTSETPPGEDPPEGES